MTPSDASSEIAEDDLTALAERVRMGDRAAESRLVARFSRGVRLMLRKYLSSNDPNLDDLAQDVMIATLEALRAGRIRDARALPGYLQTTVVRCAQGQARRPSNNHKLHQPIDENDAQLAAPEPTNELDQARRAKQLRLLLQEIPVARDREVLLRFYLDEQPIEQICAELLIDPEHLRRVLHRARTRFKPILERAGIRAATD
jgi:RNA polymerase sigma factor (sigma-70 family)